ncbi:MAG: HDIG domain-containing protein [Clostridiaceae bacterium]|nr:HDIG domain-containing protein [Clostridiaceae bacterium]
MKAINKKKSRQKVMFRIRNRTIQRVLAALVTVIIAVFIIESGATPKKYRLEVGESSKYDITAPRDIVNVLLTEKLAKETADKVPPVMERLDDVPIDIINSANEFTDQIKAARQGLADLHGMRHSTDGGNGESLEEQEAVAAGPLLNKMDELGIRFSDEQIRFLTATATDEEVDKFGSLLISTISEVMKTEVNSGNLSDKTEYIKNVFQVSDLPQELKDMGGITADALIKPNSVIDEAATKTAREEAYEAALENRQIIPEGSRIVSYGDIVTEDKMAVLRELNLLETEGFDYGFAAGILAVVLMLATLLILYIRYFCGKTLPGMKETILLCVIILLALVAAWLLEPVDPLLIPIFIAPMLITIMLDLRLGMIVNIILSFAIYFITSGDQQFLYVAMIGGTASAFIVNGANQRSRLSVSGIAIAAINALVVSCMGLMSKSDLRTIAYDAALVSVNGLLSTIFTIGVLPIFESLFNIITPLKLLELANPNQPLMKKMLLEAPGTYHHSLMVGNLAESAAEAINGNALLARVGAYYHDVGKLKRPNFFKENQLSDNPHDRMTPNLSTLVITSHASDGTEIAEKYKVPLAIRDIISQHHGTTLVAYFYHKAKNGDKGESIREEDYRYPGPKPATKEAAVVMLADSVEAAVRSAAEKTEGKIETIVRNIIKDKLDDGQLDLCDLTLKDLDLIAKSFIHIFSGYFHEREEYPEIKLRRETDKSEWDPAVRRISGEISAVSAPPDGVRSERTGRVMPAEAPAADREAGKVGKQQA